MIHVLLSFLLLITLTALALNTTVPHQDCGSPFAQLTKLEIIPSCEKDVCVLTRGHNVTLFANFIPSISSKELSINVYQQDWYLNLDTVLWHHKVVCDRWNVTCPAEKGKTQYAVFHVRLPESLPILRLRLKVVLFGDEEKQMLCESVPLDLQ